MDDLQGRNINKDDIASLMSQGVLHLPDEERENNIQKNTEIEYELAKKKLISLNYIYNEYLSHDNFGDIFTITFVSFKPKKNIESLNNIPNKIYFKFSFWEIEEIFTEPGIIIKPSELKSTYLSPSPSFFIYKINTDDENNQSDKEMKITITNDPSINNYIDYKNFLNYLLFRELFIEIFDYDKQMPYGYFKIPLINFIREKKKTNLGNFSFNIYDNYNYEQKGTIELVLKSNEIKTIKKFNLKEESDKFNNFYSTNQFISCRGYEIKENPNVSYNDNNITRMKRKKLVCVAPMNCGKLTQLEKELYSQKFLEFKNKNNNTGVIKDDKNGESIQNTMNNKATGSFLDQNLEKRIRVLRFLDTHHDNGKTITLNSNIKENDLSYLKEDLMKANTQNYREEKNYYETLNYTNYIKNINKETLIEKTIGENNKNILTIALIQGEPHYFNFILSNETSHKELYHIIISKNDEKESKEEEEENEKQHPFYSDANKNDKSRKYTDNIVNLVTDSKEYKYITKLKGLEMPNGQDYNYISKDGNITIEPHHSIPLLFKCLSYKSLNEYDDNNQSKYSIFIYNENNIPQYFLNVNIIKVFPIIDFEFYFNIEEKKLNQIQFPNPFKNNSANPRELLKTYHYINSIDKNSDINIKLDPLTNDLFFNFNNLTNLADNQINLNSNETQNSYQNNYNDSSLNNNQRLLFLYKDIYKTQLEATYRFFINAYDCINICTDLGVKKKYKLLLPIVDSPKTIKLYSSNEDILYFQGRYKENIIMIKNMRYEVEYTIYSKKVENHEILINCIDIFSNEIIKTWLIKIGVNTPRVSQIIKVDCLIGTSTQTKFYFKSPLNTWSVLHFESSNKYMVELQADQIAFNSEENKIITINIGKCQNPGRETAYVFISDNDNLFNQTIQIDVNYY